MSQVNPQDLWFNTPDTHTLCRAGGNGPEHPSQLYALKKYLKYGMKILDYGSGSATTWEALKKVMGWPPGAYLGVDIIPKNVDWCKENYPETNFEVNPSIHKIDQPDQSFDVVYSRHVVDHMEFFESAMDEHLRVAKQLVIVVFWVPLSTGDEHDIKNIVDGRGTENEKLYPNEYTNSYSRKKVMEWLDSKKEEWDLLEMTEDIGVEVKGHDWVLVLRRKNA